MLTQIIDALRALGEPGLLVLAWLDSAGLPTGGAPDMVILFLGGAAHSWGSVLLIGVAAAVGSTAGSAVLFYTGRRGGRPVLARFSAERLAAIHQKLERHGLWAMIVAVVAPPPYPMKLFVLSAGVFGMPWGLFVAAVLTGRCMRYLAVASLAFAYGERAGDLLTQHAAIAGTALLVVAAVALVAWWRQRGRTGAAS